MSSLGREGAARPKDRLPRAPQLVMAPQLAVVPQPVVPHAEEPPPQSLGEDATGQSELGPATVPQVAHDPPIQVSGPVRASRRVLKTAVALSLAVVATGALGLVLFPNAPREAARYYSLLRPAATAPHGASVSKREERPSHSPSGQSAPPTPPVANAAPVVASADAAAQQAARPHSGRQPGALRARPGAAPLLHRPSRRLAADLRDHLQPTQGGAGLLQAVRGQPAARNLPAQSTDPDLVAGAAGAGAAPVAQAPQGFLSHSVRVRVAPAVLSEMPTR